MDKHDFSTILLAWSLLSLSLVPRALHGPIKQRFYELINEILWKFSAAIVIVMIQLGHKFAHVTTAKLSWHVQNCDLIGSQATFF